MITSLPSEIAAVNAAELQDRLRRRPFGKYPATELPGSLHSLSVSRRGLADGLVTFLWPAVV